MNNLTKTAALGLFVIVGAILFLGGALWLRGKSLGADDVHILYADIGNLKEGAPVRISGAPVGRVTDIVYQDQGRVAVGVKFSEKITVRQGATAEITSVGMLGDEVIMLDPGKGAPLALGDTITGSIAAGVFDKAAVIADQAAQTLTKVNAMLDPKLVADLRNTLNSTQQFMAFLADQKNGPTSQVNATMAAAQKRGWPARFNAGPVRHHHGTDQREGVAGAAGHHDEGRNVGHEPPDRRDGSCRFADGADPARRRCHEQAAQRSRSLCRSAEDDAGDDRPAQRDRQEPRQDRCHGADPVTRSTT